MASTTSNSNHKKTPAWENQRQFFVAAAEAMRRVLIDRTFRRQWIYAKRWLQVKIERKKSD